MFIKKLDCGYSRQIFDIEQKAQSFPWTLNAIEEVFKYPYYTVLGAFDGEQLCGFIIFDEIAGESNIHDLAVMPVHQNKGIGGLLLNRYIKQITGHGISRSLLEVRISNASARHLYDKLNYKQIAIRKNYYRTASLEKEDAVIMENRL